MFSPSKRPQTDSALFKMSIKYINICLLIDIASIQTDLNFGSELFEKNALKNKCALLEKIQITLYIHAFKMNKYIVKIHEQ